ncbi:MAG TPA: YbaK/EbsC family protein [Patescibacteria group bacterium]|nr:YbaK/EbsC family protein [Patescibacteria group bacterium]
MEVQVHPLVHSALEKYGLVYQVLPCDPALADTAEFCAHYGFSLSQSSNTIIVALKGNPPSFVCCVVLATTKLDVNKKLREVTGKKGSFASMDETKEQTGMEIGGVVAIGVEHMPIYVDSEVFSQKEIIMGGGNRTSKLLLDPHELEKIPELQIIAGLAIPKNSGI